MSSQVGRPSTPLISRPAVVEAALRVIGNDGLSKLSLKRLAAELGVHESSIYHHYRYKKNILADVLRHLLSQLVVQTDDRPDWKTYLIDAASLYYRALAQHPQMVIVLMDELPRTLGLGFENQTAQVLLDAGFPPRYVLVVREQLEALTNGALQFADKRLFDEIPEELTALRKAAGAGNSVSAEERFLIALRAYLDGLEAQLAGWSTTEVGADIGALRHLD